MDSTITHNSAAVLQQRLGDFLAPGAGEREAMREVLCRFHECECQPYLFGGLLRDLMIQGRAAKPRDVDIVVSGASTTTLERLFHDYLDRKTRFGGLHLKNRGWMFDVWPLEETWAFKHGSFNQVSFSELPRTAFLNVEAVVAELIVVPGKERKTYDRGFFEGITSKVVELNYEENPFPALCVVRSLVIAADLGFDIGPMLARYILEHMNAISISHLMDAQLRHYGTNKLSPEALRQAHKALLRHSYRATDKPVRLPEGLQRLKRLSAPRIELAKMQQ